MSTCVPLRSGRIQPKRAIVLELMVVIILIIELIYFFRGKPI